MRVVLNVLFAAGAVRRLGPAQTSPCGRRCSFENAPASRWQAARGDDGAEFDRTNGTITMEEARLISFSGRPGAHADSAATPTRRALLAFLTLETASSASAASAPSASAPSASSDDEVRLDKGTLRLVKDPATYSALAYAPRDVAAKTPLLIVLPGAAQNTAGVWSLADPAGEHMGLAPSLLASGAAPSEMANNFAVVTPYPEGKRSFYEEPRAKVQGAYSPCTARHPSHAHIPNAPVLYLLAAQVH